MLPGVFMNHPFKHPVIAAGGRKEKINSISFNIVIWFAYKELSEAIYKMDTLSIGCSPFHRFLLVPLSQLSSYIIRWMNIDIRIVWKTFFVFRKKDDMAAYGRMFMGKQPEQQHNNPHQRFAVIPRHCTRMLHHNSIPNKSFIFLTPHPPIRIICSPSTATQTKRIDVRAHRA